jgi:PAS domain S-box-containing protein
MLLLFTGGPLYLSTHGGSIEELQFRTVNPPGGLPAGAVHSILRDSRGFMWFGTYDGLVRYDGAEALVYRHDPKDPRGLPDSRVRSLVEDKDGNLWVGTEQGGFAVWERNLERFTSFGGMSTNSLSPRYDCVRSLLLDHAGSLWIGFFGGGLGRMNLRTRELEKLPVATIQQDGLPTHDVSCLLEDRKGRIWIGMETNILTELDPLTGRYAHFPIRMPNPLGPSPKRVRSLCEDGKGTLWLGTDLGPAWFDLETRTFRVGNLVPGDLSAVHGAKVDSLYLDRQGHVWVGTDGSGLGVFTPSTGRFKLFRRDRLIPESLSSDVVRTVYQDPSGDYWVGTYPDSVNYASPLNLPFQTVRSAPGRTNSLSDESANCFLEDRQGRLWVGTDRGGLSVLDPVRNQWSAYQYDPRNPAGPPATGILSLCEDHLGRLWIGTWVGGLSRLEHGAFRHYSRDLSRGAETTPPHVWAVLQDSRKDLWVGTSTGVYRYDEQGDVLMPYRHDSKNPAGLNQGNIRCFLVTRDGQFWAGTVSGLARRNPATQDFERVQVQKVAGKDPFESLVVDLMEDWQGRLWIATQSEGVMCWSPGSQEVKMFTVADGLPSNATRSVLEDQEGRIWVATNDGLMRHDPATGGNQAYQESVGLQGDQFINGARLRLRDGILLFGGIHGYTQIRSAELRTNDQLPPVVLTRLEVLNEPVVPGSGDSPLKQSITETRELTISARSSVFSLQFAALSYRSAEQNQYLYKLEGFDGDWRKAGTERRATYTNLDPGRYRFRVKASNSDGVWNMKGVNLALVIAPLWWQTLWFQGGALLALTGGFAATGWGVASRRAKRRVREIELERQRALERQQAVETLRESETRYRELFEHANDGITVVQDGVVKAQNARFAQLCGYPLDEVIGKPFTGFVHPEDLALMAQRHSQRLSGDQQLPSAYRFRLIRKDGTLCWIELNVGVIHWEGRPATLNILRDISPRIEAEEQRLNLERQMQQVQKLESLGVMAGGIAHDFNNLLTAILGNLDLATEELPSQSPARESMGYARQASLQAAELCRQMLAYSGRGRFEIETLHLSTLVEGLVNLLKTTISKKARLDCHLMQDISLVRGDASQLRQVVMNLVINASEALGENSGWIRISTGTLPCSAEELRSWGATEDLPGGTYVWLEVSDNGSGMDPETQRRVFEPFFTTKFTGRGLGLSAVQGIVRGHKGVLKLSSRPGEGTTFRILLPATDAPRIPSEKLPAVGGGWKGSGLVLLVEDEARVRAVGQKVLERLGFSVLLANDGREAVDLYRTRGPEIALVLLDLTMPEMSGEEAFVELRKLNPSVRVIIASGYSETDVVSRFEGLGLIGFVQKPYSMDTLEKQVRRALA